MESVSSCFNKIVLLNALHQRERGLNSRDMSLTKREALPFSSIKDTRDVSKTGREMEGPKGRKYEDVS